MATVLFSGVSWGQQYLPTDDQLDALAKLSATQYFIDVNNELSEIYTAPSKRAEADEIASK